MHKLLTAGILITFGLLIICIFGGCGDDDPPEKVTDPPQPEDDVQSPPAIKVMVDPASGDYIPPHTEFTLTFNEEVVVVTVNGTPAAGSGRNWRWRAKPILPEGPHTLKIMWTNRDGSTAFAKAGPYEVVWGGGEPPDLTSGTVFDGAADVDPALINQGGLRYDFNERITGTIKLTDEAGADLNWIGAVAGQTATLTPVAGQELVNETTYKIEIDVQDGAGNPLKTTITFVTKPK